MKRTRFVAVLGLSLGAAAAASWSLTLLADQYHCPVVSAGAETNLGPASYHNLGQACIGRGTNATTVAHAGALACLRAHVVCLLGDVDNNGLRDGEDVDDYARVKITGTGTPQELCAASPDLPTFVAIILAGP